MDRFLPGTVLTLADPTPEKVDSVFSALFVSGGLVLSQVAQVTGLELHTIQNWVKRGFLSKPVGKKYSRRQLSRIILINMLRSVMPLDAICSLLGYINGQLDDESDDSIDDAQLYIFFLRAQREQVESILQDYTQPFPGARERIAQVLGVMQTAWEAARLQQKALDQMEQMMQAQTL